MHFDFYASGSSENKSYIDILSVQLLPPAAKQALCLLKCQNSPFHIVAVESSDVERYSHWHTRAFLFQKVVVQQAHDYFLQSRTMISRVDLSLECTCMCLCLLHHAPVSVLSWSNYCDSIWGIGCAASRGKTSCLTSESKVHVTAL